MLLVLGGIETNPGPSYNHKTIAVGSYHQESVQHFHPQSVGRQCVPNSIASIAFAKLNAIHTWTQNNVNTILINGDKLYRHVSSPHDLLEFEDLPSRFDMYGSQFIMSKGIDTYCNTSFDCITSTISDLFTNKTSVDMLLLLGDQ